MYWQSIWRKILSMLIYFTICLDGENLQKTEKIGTHESWESSLICWYSSIVWVTLVRWSLGPQACLMVWSTVLAPHAPWSRRWQTSLMPPCVTGASHSHKEYRQWKMSSDRGHKNNYRGSHIRIKIKRNRLSSLLGWQLCQGSDGRRGEELIARKELRRL